MRMLLSGDPRPAPRPKVTRNGVYYPAWYDNMRDAWALEAQAQIAQGGMSLLTGRVGARLVFYRATRRTADPDNLTKGVLDSLNGVAFTDDRLIDRLDVVVHRGVGIERARVVVELWALDKRRTRTLGWYERRRLQRVA